MPLLSSSSFSLVPAKSLYVSRPAKWLESRFHFSFAEYWDQKRTNCGVLRVLNDDIVQPLGGFPPHPHRDMEIMSYVVEGGLTHQDSMGSKETLTRGAVQYMSAGTGVRHSEFNISPTDKLRFLQLWISPKQRGLKPNYGSKSFNFDDRKNKLLHLISGDQKAFPGTIEIHQDANIFVSEITPDNTAKVSYNLKAGRQAYLVAIEGLLDVSGISLEERAAMQVAGPSELVFESKVKQGNSHFLMVEMAKATQAGGEEEDDGDW